jgi:hypothetical protein
MKKEFNSVSHDRAKGQDNPASNLGKKLATTVATTDPKKKQDAVAKKRLVQFEFSAAALETGKDAVVTDSASNLNGLPYAITSATDKSKVIAPTPNPKATISYGKLTKGKTKGIFTTVTAEIPDDIEEVVIYLGNDAYVKRRLHPLFKFTPSAQGISHIKIYETHKVALEKQRTKTPADYPVAAQGQTVVKSANEFVGYLTGDVWKELSYEFTDADVKRLCKKSSLKRKFVEDRGRSDINSENNPTNGVTAASLNSVRPPTMAIDNTRVVTNRRIDSGLPGQAQATNSASSQTDKKVLKEGEEEKLEITDWTQVLSPIYNGQIQGLTGTDRATYSCHVDIPQVNIRLVYQAKSFNNALGAGEQVTIPDVLKRTHPLAYKGIIEAAWVSGADVVTLSSTWRPMLGSILHRMGVSIDVVFVDDLDDQDAKKNPIKPFQVHLNSGKAPSAPYTAFETHIFEDKEDLGGFKADPWKRKAGDNLHKNHLHVSATDADAI